MLKLLSRYPRVAQDPLHYQEVGFVGDEQGHRTQRPASSTRCVHRRSRVGIEAMRGRAREGQERDVK
jgi:hypothetical protein